jgi:hypothetical protein
MSKASKKSKKGSSPKARVAPAKKGSVMRRDGSGHVDPAHAKRLLALSREAREAPEARTFVSGPRPREAIAEELGEGAVVSMTTGEDSLTDTLDENSEEENGGPFVETTASEEFAAGTDESNIDGATREPFPRTSGGSGR